VITSHLLQKQNALTKAREASGEASTPAGLSHCRSFGCTHSRRSSCSSQSEQRHDHVFTLTKQQSCCQVLPLWLDDAARLSAAAAAPSQVAQSRVYSGEALLFLSEALPRLKPQATFWMLRLRLADSGLETSSPGVRVTGRPGRCGRHRGQCPFELSGRPSRRECGNLLVSRPHAARIARQFSHSG
jgi:hypothetical protein